MPLGRGGLFILIKAGETMRFTKMEGLGNDYVYINAFEEMVENPSALAVEMSRAHFGCGSDGLILIKPSEKADFCMECTTMTAAIPKCAATASAVWPNTAMTAA